jgi:peptidyl-prolyl cis-trans isomerase B (cyclophilin B)
MKLLYVPILMLLFTVMTISCGEQKRKILIETEYGKMTFELYNSTPKHRDNMVKLVNEGYYDDLLFHRIINGFMIQGGDPQSKNAPPAQSLGMGGPGYLIDAEIGAPHFKGTLAAARTGGASNPEKKSSGSQFYIVQGQPYSDHQLTGVAQMKGIAYSEAQIQKYAELGGTPELDMDYTVFGEIVDGIEVIDKIAQVPTGEADRPEKDVKMKIRMLN